MRPRYKCNLSGMVVEAIQWDGVNVVEMIGFIITKNLIKKNKPFNFYSDSKDKLLNTANVSDYVIDNLKGQYYKCEPISFKSKYTIIKHKKG